MRTLAILAAMGALLFASTGTNAESEPENTIDARVTVHDEHFRELIAKDSQVEVLASDLGWAEGPVWSTDLNALLFSDVAAGTIYRWDDANGLNVFLTPSGHPPDDGPTSWRGSNGLAIDNDGQLVLAQQARRTLARMNASLGEPAPDFETLVTQYEGKSINSPNDLVIHRSGDVYFTDPPYGLSGFENSPAIELEFFGVFRLSADGELTVVNSDLDKPNGIALSPDQSTLYVSNSEEGSERIVEISLDEDGHPESSRLFFDASNLDEPGAGSTDGMTVHPSGSLFVSIPGGLAVLSAAGELLGTITLGQVTNLALDASSSTLFITTPNQLLRIKVGKGRT